MTREQMEMMMQSIKGYDFAYQATKQDCYRNTRDNLLSILKAELKPTNLHQLRAA